MLADLMHIFSSEKALSFAPAWILRDRHYLSLSCPLEIDGVTIQGLELRAGARASLPDEAVRFQLQHQPAGGKIQHLARIEWRPISIHNNKGLGPLELRNTIIKGCHHHEFGLNFLEASKAMRRGDLKVAVPIEETLADFATLLAFVGKKFRIVNMELIVMPPWQGRMV
jgi:hypothetical protein